jgi:hypothetical protein
MPTARRALMFPVVPKRAAAVHHPLRQTYKQVGRDVRLRRLKTDEAAVEPPGVDSQNASTAPWKTTHLRRREVNVVRSFGLSDEPNFGELEPHWPMAQTAGRISTAGVSGRMLRTVRVYVNAAS